MAVADLKKKHMRPDNRMNLGPNAEGDGGEEGEEEQEEEDVNVSPGPAHGTDSEPALDRGDGEGLDGEDDDEEDEDECYPDRDAEVAAEDDEGRDDDDDGAEPNLGQVLVLPYINPKCTPPNPANDQHLTLPLAGSLVPLNPPDEGDARHWQCKADLRLHAAPKAMTLPGMRPDQDASDSDRDERPDQYGREGDFPDNRFSEAPRVTLDSMHNLLISFDGREFVSQPD